MVVFFLVTLGLSGVWWYYRANRDLRDLRDEGRRLSDSARYSASALA